MFEPWRSDSTIPASFRTLRWCETVGWRTSQQVVKSHAQTSLDDASSRTIASRTGSARAARSLTSGSSGRAVAVFDVVIASATLSTIFDIDKRQYACHIDDGQYRTDITAERSHQMYPIHFAGALRRVEDPREVRNRTHLLAVREAENAARRLS